MPDSVLLVTPDPGLYTQGAMAFCSGTTIAEIYLKRLERTPERIAFIRPEPHLPQGRAIPWREFHRECRLASLGLLELGVRPGERVVIQSSARYEWPVCEIAILGARAVSVPVDALHPAQSLQSILRQTGARIVFAENIPQLERMIESLATAPDEAAPTVIVFDASGGVPSHCEWNVLSWDRLRELGQARDGREPGAFERGLREIRPDDPLTIALTSGTTDEPHGAVLTHRAAVTALEDLGEALHGRIRPDQETIVSYLPFAHHLGRIESLGGLYFGWIQAFSEGPARVFPALAQHQPTLLVCGARLLDKLYSRYRATLPRPASDGARRSRIGALAGRARRTLAGRGVLKAAAAEMGGRLRLVFPVSGPVPGRVSDFCRAAGFEVLEGYGLAEVCGPVTLNLAEARSPDTAGRPLGQLSLRISDDGEIWIKSPKAAVGFEREWLRTGDIGWLDDDGYLHVKERRNDLIVTSAGDVVFPQEIESRARLDRFIRDFVVFGDDRRFLSALVTLRREEILKYARDHDILFSSYSDLIRTPQIRRLVQKSIDRINQDIPARNAVRRFCLIPADFSVEGGELSPSRRPRRRAIREKYQAELQALYQDNSDSDDRNIPGEVAPS